MGHPTPRARQRGRTRPARVALVLLPLLVVLPGPAASAHERPRPVTAAREHELRAFETRVLGSSHAGEHARARVAVRRRAQRLRRLSPAARSTLLRRERAARVRSRGRIRARAAATPAEAGAWGQSFDIPIMAINAAVLRTGKVMWFAYPVHPGAPGRADFAQAWLWDPKTGETRQVDPPIDPLTGKPANIWCAGTSFLADGRVLVTGGNFGDPAGSEPDEWGLKKVFTFDPESERWTEQPEMAQGRWYPSQLLMPDGRTVILSGKTAPGERDNTDHNRDIELFTPSRDAGGRGSVRALPELLTGGPGGPPTPGLYPHTFWMPNGQGLVAGPRVKDSWLLRPPRRSNGRFAWTALPPASRDRVWGTGILMPGNSLEGSTRVMQLGGSPVGRDSSGDKLATATTEVIDVARPDEGWKAGPSLQVARSHHNTVLLPDGNVLTLGGGYGAKGGAFEQFAAGEEHKQVELHDPRTGATTLGPAEAESRAYHSTAVLLPDGRVVSAGDDYNGPTGPGSGTERDTAQVYSPPYLFKGPRPIVRSAPAAVRFGDAFGIETPNGADIRRAVLMAPGATTHANDMSQRLIELEAPDAVPQGVNLYAPADRDLAPPGVYMLFLINGRGVPSEARFVRVDPSAASAPALADADGRRPADLPGLGIGEPEFTTSAAAFTTSGLRRSGRLRVRVQAETRGRVSVRADRRRASGRFRPVTRSVTVSFARGGSRSVTLRLSSGARCALPRHGRVTLGLRLVAPDGAGGRSPRRRVTARSRG